MTTTRQPVVLIHGVFGYGRQRPLWGSTLAPPYWPERSLDAMRANYLMVDVGVLSSDHDRACEAFYQLVGGRVDYGELHAAQAGHDRYGEIVPKDKALHPDWSEDNPVHLLGHSFGSTTAIELYQLLCADFFGVGSSHRWVRSIVSIAGPLAGSAMPHAFGLHASPPEGEMRALSLGHAVGSSLGLWFRLHNASRLVRGLFPFRMPQWESRASGPLSDAVSPHGPLNASRDLAVYNLLPRERMERNSQLRDMDKVFLVSVATSDVLGPNGGNVTAVVLLTLLALVTAVAAVSPMAGAASLAAVLAATWLTCRQWLLLSPSSWLLQQCNRSLHCIFPGFDREEWSANDGVVNVHAMLRPWTAHWVDSGRPVDAFKTSLSVASSLSTAASDGSDELSDWSGSSAPPSPTAALRLSLEDADNSLARAGSDSDDSDDMDTAFDGFPELQDAPQDGEGCKRGEWYVRRVSTHHMTGTHFDRGAPALMASLMALMRRFEQDKP